MSNSEKGGKSERKGMVIAKGKNGGKESKHNRNGVLAMKSDVQGEAITVGDIRDRSRANT